MSMSITTKRSWFKFDLGETKSIKVPKKRGRRSRDRLETTRLRRRDRRKVCKMNFGDVGFGGEGWMGFEE